MTRLIFLKLIFSIAFIVAGVLAVLIGVIVAIIVDVQWLLISLGGLLCIAIGASAIALELKKFVRLFKQLTDSSSNFRFKR